MEDAIVTMQDEIAEILKIQDIPRIAFGREFSQVFRPFSNFTRATNRDYDYKFPAESQYPAYFNPLIASVTFVEKALEKSKKLARKLGLNPLRFRQLYGLGSWMNELRHWRDLVNGKSCNPLHYKAQVDHWLMSLHIALVGSKSIENGYYPDLDNKRPSKTESHMVGPTQAYSLIVRSSLWTETLALDEEQRFFGSSNTKEARILHKACNIQPSEKPCSQIDGCAIHALASFIARKLYDKFGSLAVTEQYIRKKAMSVPKDSNDLEPDIILTALLTLDDDQVDKDSIDFHVKNQLERIRKSEVQFSNVNEFKGRLLVDALSESPATTILFAPALVVGKIANVLRDMLSLAYLDQNQIFGRIFVRRNNWSVLNPKEKKLCLDLFRLRQDAFHTFSSFISPFFECKNRKRCPIIECARTRKYSSPLVYFRINTHHKEQLSDLQEKYSHVLGLLKEYYMENRVYFERRRKVAEKHIRKLH